jgi:hypothetical protein
MMSSLKPKIHHADVLLRCSKQEHENCAVLRDALMKNFKNVTMAYTTRTDMDTDYCVSASAIVKDGEITKFKNQLNELKGTGKNKFKVSKVKLFVSKQ